MTAWIMAHGGARSWTSRGPVDVVVGCSWDKVEGQPETGGGASWPLAEGLVLTAMRRAGVPLQCIRPALARLDKELGLQHALASSRLYTDGAEVLYDYAETGEDAEAARAAA